MKSDQRRDLYNAVFQNTQGLKVLADLEKECNFKYTSFNENPIIMANREGRKDLIRHIRKQLEAK
jgi:hypothetical protein